MEPEPSLSHWVKMACQRRVTPHRDAYSRDLVAACSVTSTVTSRHLDALVGDVVQLEGGGKFFEGEGAVAVAVHL